MKTLKQFVLYIFLLMTTANIFAQQANRLRGSVGLGYANPSGAGGGFGLGFDINLGWNLMDNLNVGARFGGVAMLNTADPYVAGNLVGGANNWHILATSTYFFNPGNSGFAFFGGVGFGSYFMASYSGGFGGAEAGGGAMLGCMLTAGFEVGRFRFAFEYHIVADSDIGMTGLIIGYRNNNYWGLTVGFTFGGGGRWGQACQQRTPRQQVSPRHRALPCPPGQMRHQRSWDRPSSVFNHPSGR